MQSALKQQKNLILLLFIFVIVVVCIFLVYNKSHRKNTEIDKLAFSNTQVWDSELYKLINTIDLENSIEVITLPDPPTNSSYETNNELLELHALVAERSPEKINEIMNEVNATSTLFGPFSYQYIINSLTHSYTKELLERSLINLQPIIITFKKKFDRVRPSYLDPSLTTVIPVPNHPSYPSGHATQWYFLAKIMSDVDPKHSKEYMDSAYSIARNREIAGLHYPSDSEAGRLLGEQSYKYLSETDWYREMVTKAYSEWNN